MPALGNVDDDDLPEEVADLFAIFPRSRSGLVMLGGAAHGEFEVHVDAQGVSMECACKRAAKALKFTDRIGQYVQAQVDGGTFHAGWTLLSKCVAHAHDYDARVSDPWSVQRVAEPVRQSLERQVSSLFGGFSYHAMKLARLPPPLGGLGLRFARTGLHADAAR